MWHAYNTKEFKETRLKEITIEAEETEQEAVTEDMMKYTQMI